LHYTFAFLILFARHTNISKNKTDHPGCGLLSMSTAFLLFTGLTTIQLQTLHLHLGLWLIGTLLSLPGKWFNLLHWAYEYFTGCTE
jgi:hypothetical protein